MTTATVPPTANDHRLAVTCWAATAILASFLCLTQLGAMLSLLAGRVGFTAVAPVGLVLAFLLGDRLAVRAGLSGRSRWWPAGIALGVFAAAVTVSAWYFDLSWDGQWYHQTAIYAIARDWDPLSDPMRLFLSHLKLWVRHYAKGPWYVAAAVYSTTGQIELGKITAILAPVAMGLAVFAAALDWNLSRRRAAAIALLVALNPVALSELTTYLVDGIMIGFLMVVVAAVFSTFRRPQPIVLWVGVLGAIVSINAKFTGLVFLCFVFAAGWLWCAARQRAWLWRYTGWSALALLLGTVVFGYNPYVTNTIYVHQPFYPVLGSKAYPSLTAQGREGIILYETPKNFLRHDRLVRLGYATFGRPGNAPYAGVRDAALMVPFDARPADLSAYRYHETRVAGFGPWFSGIFVLSFLLGTWLLFQRTPTRWAALLTVVAVAGSLLISPHLWWPRYGPQLWLLPIVPLGFVFWSANSRRAVGMAWVLSGMLVVNAIVVAGVRLHWETQATRRLRAQLTELSRSGREIEISLQYFEIPVGERLKTWGIRFVPRRRNEIRDGTELESVVEGYPGAIRYRSMPEAATGPGAP
ncbi:MAG TPA: hypothetical protein VHE61_23590 [Opitutaceae bacterium]|nr:hypothetical protein [Opitutaceae bacterium]